MEVFEGAKPNVKTVNGQAPDSVGNVNAGVVSVEENNGTVTVTDANGNTSTFKTGGIPIGHEFFTTNPKLQAGCIPLLGGEYSRAAYPDLWAWVQTQDGYLLDESAWQEKATANGGNVPFYSKGNGSTTFRVPALKCWVRGANRIDEVGGYLSAGLPNIEGDINQYIGTTELDPDNVEVTGAFSASATNGNGDAGRGQYANVLINFDASLSNPIYGNSDTVQPPSIVGLWVVKAYGTVTNVGSTDVSNIATGLTELETRFSALENSKVDKAGNAWVVETYRNGTEWYRVWSDGWLEQGGQITDSRATLTFLKPFANANYYINALPTKKGNWGGLSLQAVNRTAMSTELWCTATNSSVAVNNWQYNRIIHPVWYACGQGAG